VSTAYAPAHLTRRAGARQFLLRRLHSLTGIVFGGYLVVHLLINASLVQGQHPVDVFGMQVDKIHSLPFLTAIEWAFIYLPIIFHTVYGIAITVAARWNVGDYPYGKNVYYTLQRISAMVIVAFILFHILGMKGLLGETLAFRHGPGEAAATTARHINSHWAVAYLVYPLGILASCYHLANGFWTAAITWGLTISKGAQRRWGYACAGLSALAFVCGMTAWVAAMRLKGMPVP
jgi:succinate dehydrogenase / fumarate reductase, cytochrome b subunit